MSDNGETMRRRVLWMVVLILAGAAWFLLHERTRPVDRAPPTEPARTQQAARTVEAPQPDHRPEEEDGDQGSGEFAGPGRHRPGPSIRTGPHSRQSLAPGRGAIDFTLKLQGGVDPNAFHVAVFSVQADGVRRVGDQAPYGDGQFTFPDLQPGRYLVRYYLTGDPSPLATVEDVLVGAGRINRDPRLSTPPLEMFVRPVTIRVVDEAGNAVPGVDVCLDADPSSFYAQSHVVATDARGVAVIPVTASGQRPVLRHRGYRTVRARPVVADTQLVIPNGLSVELRVAAVGTSLPDDVVLLLVFNHEDSLPDRPQPIDAWVPNFQAWTESLDAPILLKASRHGTYRVEAHLAPKSTRRFADSLPPSPIGSFPNDFKLTLRDVAGTQSTTLLIPRGAFAAALKDLREEQESAKEQR
jgi:hypothetical protein